MIAIKNEKGEVIELLTIAEFLKFDMLKGSR
jgi:hypothetical protein